MKSSMRMLAFSLFALAFLAAPAYADRMDVGSASVFGSVVSGPTTNTFSFFGFYSADVTSTVYYDSSTGVYTYVYSIGNYSGGKDIDFLSVGSPYFDPSLDWGIVTGGTSSGVGLDTGTGHPDVTFGAPSPQCTTGRTTGFMGCNPVLTFNFSDGTGYTGGLLGSEYITVYAQSFKDPGTASGSSGILVDSDYAIGNLTAPVPEPGTMALFGSGLIGVAFAIRRKLLG